MTMMKKRRSSYAKEDLVKLQFKTVNPLAELRPELKEKIQNWILSFYHLDPRYKILTFFNLVASEGADNVTDDQVDEQPTYGMMKANGKSTSPTYSNMGGRNGTIRASPGPASPASGRKSPNNSRDTYRQNAHLYTRESARHIRPSTLNILASLFNATSILTVWRPCSNDAMRKMMEGTGVGKGLDIKGKSAKKGHLSAYVPFMQIFNNDHKNEIQPICDHAEMRIYYKDGELRDYVFEVLQNFKENGPPKKKNPIPENDESSSSLITPPDASFVQTLGGEEKMDEAIIEAELAAATLEDEDGANEMEKSDLISEEEEESLPPHKDPDSPSYIPENSKLKKIKRFEKRAGFYGIECSQRLFWYATVQDADISRVGTGTETGRPSLPGFQDANHKTLKLAMSQLPKPSPMPVVMQHKSLEQFKKEQEEEKQEDRAVHPLYGCLDPRHLVMAYEEQGTIKPVVSDFDGFLLGWRREALWFGCNLPRDQEALMMWCVDHIEEILDDQKTNPNNSDSWTIRWLEVQKRAAAEGFHVETPEYGFGDPKSTSIMEHAAMKLKSTGAVRHGSECFNYYFPQEIDEMFLLISDTLKPVPWKYVNVKELQVILSAKIAEGFVFPLNPKWILCDPGWKKIYDDLMASDALYADLSKDVWFPPYSGVRERIEKIHKRHPNGFQRCVNPSAGKMRGKAAVSGRRQSATNILRETLDEVAGSELTGNALADLAQLELDDFVGRTSLKPNKSMDSDMLAARATLTIPEDENEDHSSSEARGTGWKTPSKYEKRPSGVSHSSVGSGNSDKHSTQSREGRMGLSGHSSSSISSATKTRRGGKGMLSRAGKSVKNVFGSAKKTSSRLNSNLDVYGEEEHESASGSSAPSLSFTAKSTQYSSRNNSGGFEEEESNAFRNLEPKQKMASSKEMNKEPRRHFSKWNKVRANLKNKKIQD